MTPPRVLTMAKQVKIMGMFHAGFGLDYVSEQGVVEGWTRQQAKEIVAAEGYSLDWRGRLRDKRQSGLGDDDELIAAGLDHELVDIRRLAVKAQRARDDLRRALELQEEKDAEEVARRRRLREEAEAERADPSNWKHGTWSGYISHRTYDVDPCAACLQAKDRHDDEYRASHKARRAQMAHQPAVAA